MEKQYNIVWNWFWINNLTGIESQLKNTKTHVSLYSLHQWMFLVSLRGKFPVFLKYVARCFIFVHVVEHEITGWEGSVSNHPQCFLCYCDTRAPRLGNNWNSRKPWCDDNINKSWLAALTQIISLIGEDFSDSDKNI